MTCPANYIAILLITTAIAAKELSLKICYLRFRLAGDCSPWMQFRPFAKANIQSCVGTGVNRFPLVSWVAVMIVSLLAVVAGQGQSKIKLSLHTVAGSLHPRSITGGPDQPDRLKKSSDLETSKSDLIISAIAQMELTEADRKLIQAAIQMDPNQDSWVVLLNGERKAAVVSLDFRQGTSLVHLPGIVRIAKGRALAVLLKSEASQKLLEKIGLDDRAAAEHTVRIVFQEGTVAGSISAEMTTGIREGEKVVGLAIASRSNIQLAWTSPSSEAILSGIYRGFLLKRYQSAIAENAYEKALLDLQPLMAKSFAQPEDYLAAASCYAALNNRAKALETLGELLKKFDQKLSIDSLVEIGDLCLEIDFAAGQPLAELAFSKALQRMQSHSNKSN